MNNTIGEDVKKTFNARLDQLTPETKGRWGKMNVTQMLTHMNDAFRISLGMKPAVDKSTFFSRNIMFPVGIYVVPVWPRGEATAPELDQAQQGSTPRDFYTELEFLLKMMDVFNEREESKLKPHPLFGPLSKKQWRDLLVKHLNHHLRQFGV
jgi:hypothetical protein